MATWSYITCKSRYRLSDKKGREYSGKGQEAICKDDDIKIG